MQSELSGRSSTTDLWILATISFSIVAYHVLTAMFSGYGYFIDELYYVACSKRLALGYVDHPPLSIFLLALTRWLLGDGVAALRLPPALAIGGTAFTAGILARRFGGGRTAMIIAALGVAVMPDYLLMGSFYSMNAFEILLWALILYATVRLLQESNPKYFVVIGLLSGLGLEMKHTMVLYLLALFLGIALSSSRRILFSRYLFWGIVVCGALLLPNLVWQYLHGFPSLEFYRNAMVNKNIPSGPWKVLLEQVMFANPCALPVWLTGIGVLLFSKRLKKVRSLGWAFLVLLAVLMVGQSSRPDRIGAMYVALFAAGATAFEGLRPPGLGRIVPVCMIVVLVTGGIVCAPIFTPVLPPELAAKYISALGISLDIERGKTHEQLPQWLSDRLGWKELASDVAEVYRSLPLPERENAVIVSTNYGEAGALELFGPEFGLPRVYATHNSFHLWGPPPDSVKTFLAVFVNRDDLARRFDSVVEARVHRCSLCSRPQQVIPIFIARGPHFSMKAEWPKFRIYD